MKNLEIKQSLSDFRDVICRLKKIGARHAGRLFQTDTYYSCNGGRLKIREINNKKFELISYQRPDKKRGKLSNYKVAFISKNDLEKNKRLYQIFGEKCVVKKERNLWIYKHTRIHLDKVNKLGKFLELETVVKDIDIEQAKLEQAKLKQRLCLSKYNNLAGSYCDLI